MILIPAQILDVNEDFAMFYKHNFSKIYKFSEYRIAWFSAMFMIIPCILYNVFEQQQKTPAGLHHHHSHRIRGYLCSLPVTWTSYLGKNA